MWQITIANHIFVLKYAETLVQYRQNAYRVQFTTGLIKYKLSFCNSFPFHIRNCLRGIRNTLTPLKP